MYKIFIPPWKLSSFLLKVLEASSEDLSEANLPIGAVVNEKLWVDKYAPSSFTELLSDEQTNRQVLHILAIYFFL